MKNKLKNLIAIILVLIFGAGISFILMKLLSEGGIYPSGSDTMYHVFRGDVLYKSLRDFGNIPLYDKYMYNGIEPIRYEFILSPLLFALCEFVTGGNVFSAYLYYVGAIFCIGLLAWTVIGIKKEKPILGLVLGVLWFFLPNNIHTLLVEGNLSRSLAYVFLPIVFYGMYQFLDDGMWGHALWFATGLLLMMLSNLEFAGMTVVGASLFLVVYRFFWRKRRRITKIIAAIPATYMMAGVFLIPYLRGSIAAEGEEFAAAFFQNLLITLNPLYRINTTYEAYYFGVSLFVVAVLGALASNKDSAPGFITAIILVVLTATAAYPIISIIPGSEILLMLRYMSIALCLVFVGMLFWTKLRKWVLVFFAVLIALDSVPGLYWVFGHEDYVSPGTRYDKLVHETFIDEAKEICAQRIALFDLSSLGAEGAYLISGYGEQEMAVFGTGWRYSATSDNTKRLNSAMSDEYFDYLFDRCIEMGADTVIIQKDQATYGERTLVKLDRAAERLGYDILFENGGYMLYHLAGIEGAFGTKAVYDAIGIGYSAHSLSLAFPNIKETGDQYLDHYSYEYLSQFKTVYLSGFFYEDRYAAENLVRKLSENGVRVVILADGMPEDRERRTKTFMGVTCNVVQFENGYPILYTRDFGEMDCDLFPRGYSKWVTYYLNGLTNVGGTISDNNVELAFFGTGENENICYIGLNIPFYYYLTQDINAEKLMQWVMGMDPAILPRREVYPVNIDYGNNKIVIDSNVDYLNTALAYHDSFRSQQDIYVDNNMLIVRKGRTEINVVYPYLTEGIAVSALGLVLLIILLIYIRKSDIRDKEKAARLAAEAEKQAEETDTFDSESDDEVKEIEESGTVVEESESKALVIEDDVTTDHVKEIEDLGTVVDESETDVKEIESEVEQAEVIEKPETDTTDAVNKNVVEEKEEVEERESKVERGFVELSRPEESIEINEESKTNSEDEADTEKVFVTYHESEDDIGKEYQIGTYTMTSETESDEPSDDAITAIEEAAESAKEKVQKVVTNRTENQPKSASSVAYGGFDLPLTNGDDFDLPFGKK